MLGDAALSVPCFMQVPRMRQGVARLARLLPQDRPRWRHELDLEGSVAPLHPIGMGEEDMDTG